MLEAIQKWWSTLRRWERQALLVLGFILVGILIFLAGNVVGEAIGSIVF